MSFKTGIIISTPLLILIAALKGKDLLDMTKNPFNPALNSPLLKTFEPALSPCLLNDKPVSKSSILDDILLHPHPARLNGIQIWRVIWPEKTKDIGIKKYLSLVL